VLRNITARSISGRRRKGRRKGRKIVLVAVVVAAVE